MLFWGGWYGLRFRIEVWIVIIIYINILKSWEGLRLFYWNSYDKLFVVLFGFWEKSDYCFYW